MAATTDPNWLLSSVAQSAAALVAIIGGFLVSRLISLSVDRGRIDEQLRRTEAQLRVNEQTLKKAHAERLAGSRRQFIDRYLKDVAANPHGYEAELLVETFVPRGATAAEMTKVANWMIGHARRATIEASAAELEGNQAGPELLKIPEGAEEVYQAVVQARKVRGLGVQALIPGRLALETSARERQDRRIEVERSEQQSVDLLTVERSQLLGERLSLASNAGVGGTIIVLAYLALAGIVLPVGMMGLRPVPSGTCARVLVIAAFVSALLVLVVHLLRRFKTITKLPEDAASPGAVSS